MSGEADNTSCSCNLKLWSSTCSSTLPRILQTRSVKTLAGEDALCARTWLQALHGVGFHEKPCAKHSLQLHLANSQTRSLEKAAYIGLKNTSKRKQLALCKFSTQTLSNCKTAPAQGSGRTKRMEGLHIKSGSATGASGTASKRL